jgi:predicted HicB family RNase H-like nuclease
MTKDKKEQQERKSFKRINVMGFKQFNVRLTEELYKALAHESVESDRSLQDLVAEAITEFLRRKASPFLKHND